MTVSLSTDQARDLVRDSLRTVAPDADPATLDPNDSFREVLELDSLDFLSFVELLSKRTGTEIPEDDYGKLRTISSTIDYLAGR